MPLPSQSREARGAAADALKHKMHEIVPLPLSIFTSVTCAALPLATVFTCEHRVPGAPQPCVELDSRLRQWHSDLASDGDPHADW